LVETVPTFENSKGFVENTVYPTLRKGLTELCKVKPANPTVILLPNLSFLDLVRGMDVREQSIYS